jgi:hypothetical protein
VNVGILTDGTTALALTDDDELWAGRMVVGEEGAGADVARTSAVVSTLLRRWTAYTTRRAARGERPNWPTFTHLLRAFSQPVQPNRADDLRRAGNLEGAARVEAIQSLRWGDIPSVVRDTIRALFSGARPLSQQDSGAVDFAAPSHVAERMARGGVPDWQLVPSPARNALVSTFVGRNATEPRVSPGSGDSSGRWFLVALALALGAWGLS